jgi:hypothetical protein
MSLFLSVVTLWWDSRYLSTKALLGWALFGELDGSACLERMQGAHAWSACLERMLGAHAWSACLEHTLGALAWSACLEHKLGVHAWSTRLECTLGAHAWSACLERLLGALAWNARMKLMFGALVQSTTGHLCSVRLKRKQLHSLLEHELGARVESREHKLGALFREHE